MCIHVTRSNTTMLILVVRGVFCYGVFNLILMQSRGGLVLVLVGRNTVFCYRVFNLILMQSRGGLVLVLVGRNTVFCSYFFYLGDLKKKWGKSVTSMMKFQHRYIVTILSHCITHTMYFIETKGQVEEKRHKKLILILITNISWNSDRNNPTYKPV